MQTGNTQETAGWRSEIGSDNFIKEQQEAGVVPGPEEVEAAVKEIDSIIDENFGSGNPLAQ